MFSFYLLLVISQAFYRYSFYLLFLFLYKLKGMKILIFAVIFIIPFFDYGINQSINHRHFFKLWFWSFIWNFNLTNRVKIEIRLVLVSLILSMYYSFYKLDTYFNVLNVKHELAKIAFFTLYYKKKNNRENINIYSIKICIKNLIKYLNK